MKSNTYYRTLSFLMMLLGIAALWGGMIWAAGMREVFHPAGIGIAVSGMSLVVSSYPVYLKHEANTEEKE